jgi:hypothetical protein
MIIIIIIIIIIQVQDPGHTSRAAEEHNFGK